MILSDIAGKIPRFSQDDRIGLLPRCFRNSGAGIKINAVSAFILAKKIADSAWRANSAGDRSIFKKHPVLCQLVDMGGLNHGIAHASERISSLVIGQNENDIGTFSRNRYLFTADFPNFPELWATMGRQFSIIATADISANWMAILENCRTMVAQKSEQSEIGNRGVCRHFQVLEFGKVGVAHVDDNNWRLLARGCPEVGKI